MLKSVFFPRYAYFASVCRKLGNTVKDALFPGVCFACGRLFSIAHRRYTIDGYDEDGQFHFEALFEGYLCTACRSQYAEITPPMCLHCGLPFESSHGIDHLCGDCVTQPPSYAEARAAGIYQGALKSNDPPVEIQRSGTSGAPAGSPPLGNSPQILGSGSIR